jgi:hypothetical protein
VRMATITSMIKTIGHRIWESLEPIVLIADRPPSPENLLGAFAVSSDVVH